MTGLSKIRFLVIDFPSFSFGSLVVFEQKFSNRPYEPVLTFWHEQVYIYSSGSRLAQRLIFGKTNYGDLRKYLSGFFDTAVG